ncbi:MetQ/NlpA family ABC transporter substrate-binding protein [Aerococcus urinaeequi]|uniref:MetQ/NlpA family ABC transporter substrate-binding protein n=1 Tax=Aerococcus urinaeequi TaxID=51665 RepID=UPI003D6B2674
MDIRKTLKLVLAFASALIFAACGNGSSDNESAGQADTDETRSYSVGVVGDVTAEIWEDVATRLENQGIDLEVVTFSEYSQPNRALEDGELDLNAFQHISFLSAYAKDLGDSQITPIAYTIVSPMYIFAVPEITDVESIPDGVTVAVSNSATNAERAFLGLQDIGLIKLDEEAGFAPTKADVAENTKNINIIEMDPAQIARSLGDADLITIGGDMLMDAGLDPEDAIYTDTDDTSNIDPVKKNIIATTKDKLDNPDIQAIVAAYQSDETKTKIEEISGGSSIPIWTAEDNPQADYEKELAEN